jgi:hypothetical protein
MADLGTDKLVAQQREMNELYAQVAEIGNQIATRNIALTQAAWESFFTLQEKAIVAQKRIILEQAKWAKAFGIEV